MIPAGWRSYQPPNGTEGEMFMERWCYCCEREAEFRRTQAGEDGCSIVLGTMSFNPGDESYPPEWITDGSTSKCTAFEPIGEGGAG